MAKACSSSSSSIAHSFDVSMNMNVLGRKPHPLMIPSLAHKVLEYLDHDSLKSARLVSQQWGEEGWKILRKRSKIVLFSLAQMDDFVELLNSRKEPWIDDIRWFEILEDLNHSPAWDRFLRYIGKHCCETLRLNVNSLFEANIGPLVIRKMPKLRNLIVYGDCHRVFTVTPKLSCSKGLSNLESLTLCLSHIQSPYVWSMGHLALLILKTCLNLKKIECSDTQLNRLFMAMSARQINLFQKATHIVGGFEFSNDNVSDFMVKKLKLEELDLKFKFGLRSRQTYDFLSSLRETLKKLTIDYTILPMGQIPEAFPIAGTLKNVTFLHLKKFHGSIYFVEKMPQLKYLTFSQVSLPVLFAIDDARNFVRTHDLKSLEFFDYHCVHDNEDSPYDKPFRRMVEWFPNISIFRMEFLNDISLKIIILGLSHLEELYIFKGLYTDESLVGLNQFTCANLLADDRFNMTVLESQGDIYYESCIHSLKKLHTLEIGSPRLTDVSIYYGLLLAKELRTLSICANFVTDRGLRWIVDEMDIFNLHMSFCYQISLHAIKYAEWKLKGRNVSINKYCGPIKATELFKLMTGIPLSCANGIASPHYIGPASSLRYE